MTSTLYRHGRVDAPAHPGATALLVADGRIAWVGGSDEADGLADGADSVVDLDGALVTAGFVDAHTHVLQTGLRLEGLDLSAAAGVRSLADALDAVAAAARGEHGRRLAAEGAPLAGHAWDEQEWPERRAPTRVELDAAAGGAPVYLERVDLHSGVASSSFATVLRLAGQEGWSDDGHVTGAAHHAARDAVRTVGPARRDRLHRRALAAAAGAGLVALHEHSAPSFASRADLAALLDLARDPASALPLVAGYRAELCETADDARELLAALPGLAGIGGDLTVDGSVGSRTAALHAPYTDAPPGGPHPAGRLDLTAGQVANHVAAVTRAGSRAAFHVIGDRAVAEVLLGVRAATDVEGLEAVRRAGHRLEHAELIDAPALAAAVLLGLTASVQPAFDAAWGGPDGMYAARLGAGRAAAMNPFADLLAAGVPLAFGSDSPVTPFDPWGAVRAAVLHRTPDQRIGVRAAVVAHTRAGWRAAGPDGGAVASGAGELRPGAPAHLAVWRVDEPGDPVPGVRGAAARRDPVLPDVAHDGPLPRCVRTVRDGVVLFDVLG